MPADEPGRKSDRLVAAVKGARRRPGVEEILLPGERGQRAAAAGGSVEVLPAHWDSLRSIAASVELDIEQLRAEFAGASS